MSILILIKEKITDQGLIDFFHLYAMIRKMTKNLEKMEKNIMRPEGLYIPQIEFTEKINRYTELFIRIWGKTPDDPSILKSFPEPENNNRKKTEQLIDEVVGYFILSLDRTDNITSYSDNQDTRAEDAVKKGIEILKYLNLDFSMEFLKNIKKGTRDFISCTARHLPETNYKEIYQALRNVWIMNTLQYFDHKPILCSDPVFAYSMLYPLTDNPMDSREKHGNKANERISGKLSFIGKLRETLLSFPENQGMECIKHTGKENSPIRCMVGLIGQTFPKTYFPDVWNSLFGIFNAQIKSLYQQIPENSATANILKISFEKGGASVLADCYLINPVPDEKLQIFAFGFGLILQLIDDLQDMEDDSRNSQKTLASLNYKKGKFRKDKTQDSEKLICKFLAFSNYLFRYYFPSELECNSLHQKQIFRWILRSCTLMVFHHVLNHPRLYSKKFTASIYPLFPVSGKYYTQLSKRIKSLKTRSEGKILNRTADSPITPMIFGFFDKIYS